jgi:hypothetical protein
VSAPQSAANDAPRDERAGDLTPHGTGNAAEKGE